MTRLFELSEAYRQISELCSNGEGFEESLQNLQDEFEIKAINVAKIIKELEYSEEDFVKEIERLSSKRKTLQNSISSMKDYLKRNMEETNIKKIKKETISLTLTDSPSSCQIDDEQKIPSNFKTTVLKIPSNKVPEDLLEFRTDETINKKEILEKNREGIDIPGTSIIRNKHIKIS